MSSPSRSKKSSPSRKNKKVVDADEIKRRLENLEANFRAFGSQCNFNTPSALQSVLPNRGYHPLTGFTIKRNYGGKKRTRKGKKTRKGKGKKSRKTRK